MRLDFNEAVSVSHGDRQSKCKLQEAGWNPKARKSLERIIEKGAGKRLPVVFDFDNTIVSGDLSEAMLGVLASEGRLTPQAICKSLCPPVVIPGKKRISIENCSDILEYYEALLRPTAHGDADAAPMANGYVWATQALEGLTVAEAVAATATAFKLGQEPEPKYIEATQGGIRYPAPRFHPEMVELIAQLLRHEYDVWIVSATCVWSVRWTILYGLNPLLKKYGVCNGVRPDRVIGLATLLVDRNGALYKDSILVHESPDYALFKGSLMKSLRFSRMVQYPAPVYSGKVACILDAIGRNPYLCAGDSPGDHAMMRISRHRLWIDRVEKPEVQRLTGALISRTGSVRWIVQKSSPTGEQRFLSNLDEIVYGKRRLLKNE
jgi:phosphorylcholine phosphatase